MIPDGAVNLLYNDQARCVGRFGLGPDDPICPRRASCLRWQQLDLDRSRFPDGHPTDVSVHTGLCRYGSDHMLAELP